MEAPAEQLQTTLLTLYYHIDYTIGTVALAEALSSVSNNLNLHTTNHTLTSIIKLYRVLVLLDLLPKPKSNTYSTDHLRHSLRTRPFANIIHPPLPSASEIETTRTTFTQDLVLSARADPSITPSRHTLSPNLESALALLDSIDETIRSARKAWDNASKTRPAIARVEACETAWRADIKNIQKSAIAVGLASAAVRRWVEDGAKKGGVSVSVEMGHEKGLYHVSWVVPKVVSVASAAAPAASVGMAAVAVKQKKKRKG